GIVKLRTRSAPRFAAGSGRVSFPSAGVVVENLLLVVHCDKQPSVPSDPGEGGNLQVLKKTRADFYLALHRRIWQRLPSRVRNVYLVRCYGAWLHTLVCLRANRRQYFATLF